MFWFRNKQSNFQLHALIWGPKTCAKFYRFHTLFILRSFTHWTGFKPTQIQQILNKITLCISLTTCFKFSQIRKCVHFQVATSYMQPSNLTTIAWRVCCIRKREYDRKVRNTVDRKPEQREVLANAFSTLQSSTKLPSLRVPGHTKSLTV